MSRGPDAGTLLQRALAREGIRARISVSIGAIEQTRWSSATFNGARHRLTAASADRGFATWLATLPEADLPLRDHLLADLAVLTVVHADGVSTATLEALTVET